VWVGVEDVGYEYLFGEGVDEGVGEVGVVEVELFEWFDVGYFFVWDVFYCEYVVGGVVVDWGGDDDLWVFFE